MYRIVICDDELFFCNHIEKLLRKYTESLADDMDIQIYTSAVYRMPYMNPSSIPHFVLFEKNIWKQSNYDSISYLLTCKFPFFHTNCTLISAIRCMGTVSISALIVIPSSLRDVVYK